MLSLPLGCSWLVRLQPAKQPASSRRLPSSSAFCEGGHPPPSRSPSYHVSCFATAQPAASMLDREGCVSPGTCEYRLSRRTPMQNRMSKRPPKRNRLSKRTPLQNRLSKRPLQRSRLSKRTPMRNRLSKRIPMRNRLSRRIPIRIACPSVPQRGIACPGASHDEIYICCKDGQDAHARVS